MEPITQWNLFTLGATLNEQVFRCNGATKDNPLKDHDRFDMPVRKIIGKRLTFAALTGKLGETPAL
jgi:hypothetical protein